MDWFPYWAVQTTQKYIQDYGDPLVRCLDSVCSTSVDVRWGPHCRRVFTVWSVVQHSMALLTQHTPAAGTQMRDMPPWFRCLVWMEVALQLPFFFVGAYAFLLRRNWIRTPALLYGINVTSTMVRCCGMLSPLMASASRMLSV